MLIAQNEPQKDHHSLEKFLTTSGWIISTSRCFVAQYALATTEWGRLYKLVYILLDASIFLVMISPCKH